MLPLYFRQISPDKSDNLHLAATSSTVRGSCSFGLLLNAQAHPPQFSLVWDFCSSAQNFAHGGTSQPPYPASSKSRLTTGAPAGDFYHQVIAHAGRTHKKVCRIIGFYKKQANKSTVKSRYYSGYDGVYLTFLIKQFLKKCIMR